MAAVGTRYYTPNPFEIDANGVPGAAWRLFFYETGTTTPLDTYSDVNIATPNTNPVVADANGRFGTIFLVPSTAYAVELWNAATADDPVGAQIWAEDPVGPGSGGGISNSAGIIGEVRTFAGPAASIPAGWLLCYGQAVSRATYATLFALLGTTWGAGDTTTTFNLPDLRGRAMFGKDDMGGTPAVRLTSGVGGVAGNTLGASGGDQHAQTDTLVATSGSIVTDPGHTHTTPQSWSFYDHDPGGVAPANAMTNKTPPYNITSASGTTGITVATTTTVTSGLAGASQNIPPAAVLNMIIYVGA